MGTPTRLEYLRPLAVGVALLACTSAGAQPVITGVSGRAEEVTLGATGYTVDVVGRDSVIGTLQETRLDIHGRGFGPDAIVRLSAPGVEISSGRPLRDSPSRLGVRTRLGIEGNQWTVEVTSGGVTSAPFPFWVVPPRPIIGRAVVLDGGVRRPVYTVWLTGSSFTETSKIVVRGQAVPTKVVKSSPYLGARTVRLEARVAASEFDGGQLTLRVRTPGAAGSDVSAPAVAVLPPVSPPVPWHARSELWLAVVGVIVGLCGVVYVVVYSAGARRARERAKRSPPSSKRSSGSQRRSVQHPTDVAPPDRKPHVLVVEDNRTLRRLLEYRLGKVFDVATAENGRRALDAVRARTPDLIVSDVMMPVMDGFALLDTLRSDPVTATVPFVFLTAKSDDLSRQRGLREGVDDYLTKPFDVDRLIARADQIVKRSRTYGAAPPRSERTRESDAGRPADPLRVFLCHAKEDKESASALYDRLAAGGARPWMDERDLLPGQDWEYEIANAIERSHAVLVVLSSRSVEKRGYVQKEIAYALDVAATVPEGGVFVIPCRVEPCAVPRRLSGRQWVDLYALTGPERLSRSLAELAREHGLDEFGPSSPL